MNRLYFKDIENYLFKYSVKIKSKLAKDTVFKSIATLRKANIYDLTFFHNNKYLSDLKNTNAKACFILDKDIKHLKKTCIPIIVNDPYLAFALTTNLFLPSMKSNGVIDSTLKISKYSVLKKNVQINYNVVIKENCSIGDNTIILDNSIIGPNVDISNNTLIMSNCSLSNSKIGNNCIIQSGSIIGGKGFGFTPKDKVEVQHIGNVIVGDYVDIGSNTTIDRGSLDSTIIGDHCRIDNLVQIAHNVEIGKNTIIAAQTGIAGSSNIGENCIIGGQVGISGHIKIGNNVTIAARSGVTKNIPDNLTIAGFPARDIKKWRKTIVNQYRNLK